MNRTAAPLLALSLAVPAFAQDIDNTGTLPEARPGECYAKVLTPPRFEIQSEEVVIREASERIEPVPARFSTSTRRVLVREESRRVEPVAAVFEPREERVETRPASVRWTLALPDGQQPVDPHTLEGLRDAGIETENVEPGSCFAEYYRDLRYERKPVQVLSREASERVLVSAAEFETVEERMLVRDASTEIIDVPAVYRVETRSVLVEPARSEWKPGRGPIERIDNSTGEIMCLVEVPPRYETITRTVLEKPAGTRTVDVPAEHRVVEVERIARPVSERRESVPEEHVEVVTWELRDDPAFTWRLAGADAPQGMRPSGRTVCKTEFPAEYETITQQVLVSDADTDVTEIPAKYVDIEVAELEEPASVRRVAIPERTRTVNRRVQTERSRLEWRKVLCETNVTQRVVRDLQQALDTAGYDPGPVDGKLGKSTLDAIEAFQQERELDRGGLTYETLEALGVEA